MARDPARATRRRIIEGVEASRKTGPLASLAETVAFHGVTWVAVPLISALPLGAALALGRAAGALCFHVLRLRRPVVLANLAHVFGGVRSGAEQRALAAEAYRQFGMTMVELLRSLSNVDDSADLVDAPDFEKIHALQREGRGAILCSPHAGSFERMASAAVRRGIDLHAVMAPLANPRFDELVATCRRRAGLEVLTRGRISPYALLERLERGSMLGLLPDQNTRHGVKVDFLGKPARTYRGPAVLHLRSGAPLVVCVNRRDPVDPRRHHVAIRVLPVHPPGDDRDEDVRVITQRICDAMSAEILEAPGQYFWLHRRWGRGVALGVSEDEARRRRRRRRARSARANVPIGSLDSDTGKSQVPGSPER